MKQVKFILLIPMLFLVQVIAENNSTMYGDVQQTIGVDQNRTIKLNTFEKVDSNESHIKMLNPPRKTLLEVEAEARAIIAEEVAKVQIVKANALAVIARAVASVEIAKIREEQQKENNGDLF